MAKGKNVWEVLLNIGGKVDPSVTVSLKNVQQNLDKLQKASQQVLRVKGMAKDAAGGVLLLANGVAQNATAMKNAADQAGIGTEAYQKLKFAMGQSNVTAEQFDEGLKKFNLTVRQGVAGAKQLADVGLSAETLNALGPEKSLLKVADLMKTLPNDAERTRVAMALFGQQAGLQMMVAMKQGGDALAESMANYEKYGQFLTDAQIKQADAYNLTMANFKTAIKGIGTAFVTSAMAPMTQGFEKIIAIINEKLIPMVKELGAEFAVFLQQVIDHLPELIDRFVAFSGEIWHTVTAVKDFVGGWENLAKIIGLLVIAPTVLSGFKLLISVFQVLMALAPAIGGAFTFLTGALGGLATFVTATAIPAVVAFIAAFWPVIAVVAGIIALGVAIYALVKNWDTVKEAMAGAWEVLKYWGSGVLEKFNVIKDAVTGIASKIKQGFIDAFMAIPTIAKNALNILLQFISNAINGAINMANKIPMVNIPQVAIPQLAQGGIFDRPMLAQIAEAGYPEAVVPLNGSSRGQELWQQAGLQGGYASNGQSNNSNIVINLGGITINGNADGSTIGGQIADNLEQRLAAILGNQRRVSFG